AGKTAEDAADFPLLLTLQHGPLCAQPGHGRGLDEHGLAGRAGAMDNAGQLVAVVDGHRQHVVIAAHRGVGITKRLAQLGIAEQASVSATSRSCSAVSIAPMAARRTGKRMSCRPPKGGDWPRPSVRTISDTRASSARRAASSALGSIWRASSLPSDEAP